MSMTIRTNIGMGPGGIIYEDARTLAAKWIDDHTFLDERTAEIIKFRAANPNLYPEPEWTQTKFVRQQVIDFNCLRWGNNPQYCLEENSLKSPPVVAQAPRLCPDCNLQIVPKYCPTCAGQRLLGYECPQCKKEFPK